VAFKTNYVIKLLCKQQMLGRIQALMSNCSNFRTFNFLYFFILQFLFFFNEINGSVTCSNIYKKKLKKASFLLGNNKQACIKNSSQTHRPKFKHIQHHRFINFPIPIWSFLAIFATIPPTFIFFCLKLLYLSTFYKFNIKLSSIHYTPTKKIIFIQSSNQ
jgi:hypothetical protein